MSQLYLDLIISDKVKAIIEKTCQFLLENGSEHEDYLLKSKSASDENFGFLFQENPYHIYYKTYWEWLRSPESTDSKFDFYEIINRKQNKANPPNKFFTGSSNMPPQQQNINARTYSGNNNSVNTGFANSFQSQNNYPGLQNNNNGNNNSQTGQTQVKKKNRWSDSASLQAENNPRGPNFYPAMSQNVMNLPANYPYNPPINSPQLNIMNMNQMNMGANSYLGNPLMKNMGMNLILQQNNNINKNTIGYNVQQQQQQPINYNPYPNIQAPVKTYQSSDEIPVGIMAEMLKQQQKNSLRMGNLSHVFTPLDPNLIPHCSYFERFPEAGDYIKSKVDQFYKFVDEEREYERKQRRKREKEKEKERNSYEAKNQKEKFESFKRRDIQREIEDLYTERNDDSFSEVNNPNNEARMRNDGQMYGSGFHNTEERQGLGIVQSEADIYAKFRKQRSYQYHVSAEERSLTKDQPELCYVCQMPGHIARDCKFGLT